MTKIGAKHYEYEEWFTVAVDQQNRTCTVVGRDKEGRYILEQAGEHCIANVCCADNQFFLLSPSEMKNYARLALENGTLSEERYLAIMKGN